MEHVSGSRLKPRKPGVGKIGSEPPHNIPVTGTGVHRYRNRWYLVALSCVVIFGEDKLRVLPATHSSPLDRNKVMALL